MAIPYPQPGMVLSYSYLWHREYREGAEEGRKDRPVVVILAAERDEGDLIVTVAPITTSPLGDQQPSFEIPLQTKKRLRLDERHSFVVLTEVNRFLWPGPDIRPVDRERFHYGFLPAKTFNRLKTQIEMISSQRRLDIAPRTD